MTTSEKTANFDQSEPVPLDPIIISARDELLEKYSDKSFEDQITYFKAVIEGERDSVMRLSAMAARVYILRKRLAMLAGNLMEDQLNDLSSKHTDFDIDTSLSQTSDAKEPQGVGNDKSWMRLRIVDSSEVNGVRFPAGVVIDVKREDGEKLIESGKADFISTEESRHFKSEEGLDDAIAENVVKDEPADTDSVEEVVAEDAATETESAEELVAEGAAAETESAEEVVAEDTATETESVEEVVAEGAAAETESAEEVAAEDAAAETESAEEVAAEGAAAETESVEEVAAEGAAAETESVEEVAAEGAATETESVEEVAAEDAAVKLEVKEKS